MKAIKTKKEPARRDAPGLLTSLVKLGIDMHAAFLVVARQIDGAATQPPQKMSWETFLRFAAKQTGPAKRVVSCYEAGPFGFGLHRALVAMGIENIVVRAQNWDERHQGVKNDKRDAAALVSRLGRWLEGDRNALGVVHVPEPEQEMARAASRQREQVRRTRQRLEAQGRTLMLQFGESVRGQWWAPRRWEHIAMELHQPLLSMVEQLRSMIVEVDQRLREATRALEATDIGASDIKGLGRLTNQIIEREVLDWHSFKNRRAIASITGLCPRVWASGYALREGPISKCGRPRLRHALIEAAWRMVDFQPNYTPIKRRLTVLRSRSKAAKKKAIVAIARHLAVDLWRIRTGRASAKQLGLVPADVEVGA